MPSVGTKRLLSRCGTVLSGNGSRNATGTSLASLSARSRSTSRFARFLVSSVMGHRIHFILLQRSSSSMFPIDVLLLFDGLHDEVDCRHHGEANDYREKQYLSGFAEHVSSHHWKMPRLNINSWLVGAIKLLFRKLNSFLCDRRNPCSSA